jgi:hypothetical protein
MRPQQLEALGRRLLRSGITPRHVRRYLRELRDHYEDAVQEELKNGASQTTAEEAASSRLGEPDHLVESALARPELLSWSRRWPWAVYGFAPLLFFTAAFVAMIFAMIGLLGLANNPTGRAIPTPLLEVLRMIRLFNLYVLPVIAASGFALLAKRRGVSSAWAWVSITLITFVGALPNVDVSAYQIGAGIGFATRLDFLVEMFLQRWLPTAVAALMLYMAAGHVAPAVAFCAASKRRRRLAN